MFDDSYAGACCGPSPVQSVDIGVESTAELLPGDCIKTYSTTTPSRMIYANISSDVIQAFFAYAQTNTAYLAGMCCYNTIIITQCTTLRMNTTVSRKESHYLNVKRVIVSMKR